MENKELMRLLRELRAGPEMMKWIGRRDISAVWRDCQRGDWLLWIAAKMAGACGWQERHEVLCATNDCIKLALHHLGGEMLITELRLAARDAYDTCMPNGEQEIYAASGAATVARAAYIAAKVYGPDGHKRMAEIVRKILPTPTA